MTRYEERIRALNPSADDLADMITAEREELEREIKVLRWEVLALREVCE